MSDEVVGAEEQVPERPGWMDEIQLPKSRFVAAEWKNDSTACHGVALTVTIRSAQQPVQVPLEAVPNGDRLTLNLIGPGEYELLDLAPDATVEVRRLSASMNNVLRLGESTAGTVRVVAEGQNNVTGIHTSDDCSATLILESGAYDLQQVGAAVRVEIDAATVTSATVGTLHLRGAVTFTDRSNALNVENLVVHGSCRAVLANGRAQISRIGGEGEASLCFEGSDSAQPNRTAKGVVTVSEAKDVEIVGTTGVTVTGLRDVSQVRFGGPVAVEFGHNSRADGIEFRHAGGALSLKAGGGAVLLGVAGQFRIQSIERAHLAAADPQAGFEVVGLAQQSQGRSPTTEAFISGWRVPSGLTGRTLLNHFEDAHHLEPATDDLPGWDLRIGIRAILRRPWRTLIGEMRDVLGAGPPNRQALQHDAELLRKMHLLVREKGASGAARTKVGWCAQRLRHVTTSGRAERLALLGYRLLGYGERPGPALITWVALSLLVAVAVTTAESWTGHWGLANWTGPWGLTKEFLSQAFGPLTALTRTGAPDAEPWEFVARAAIAVPLVVGLLSLRHYVRSSD